MQKLSPQGIGVGRISLFAFLAPARSPVSHFVLSLCVCVFKPELWHFLAMNVSTNFQPIVNQLS